MGGGECFCGDKEIEKSRRVGVGAFCTDWYNNPILNCGSLANGLVV
jgi:hypothetical protein